MHATSCDVYVKFPKAPENAPHPLTMHMLQIVLAAHALNSVQKLELIAVLAGRLASRRRGLVERTQCPEPFSPAFSAAGDGGFGTGI